MKNYTQKTLKKLQLPLIFLFLISINSFAQGQINQGASSSSVQVETVIIKAPGIKSDEVFLKYKSFLLGLKGVSILGRALENEYMLIEIDNSKNQLIEVLQPLKDNGYYFEFLYHNPTPQKLQEILSIDPLVN